MAQSWPNTAAGSQAAATSANVDFPVPGGPVIRTRTGGPDRRGGSSASLVNRPAR